jgi:putative phage-type endonuclease
MSNPYQRTEQWFKDREGKLTASSFGQAAGLAPGSRQQLWRRLLGLEVFEGNAATAWGEQYEPIALKAYMQAKQINVDLSGFIAHREHDWLGGSPDFLVGLEGLGEIKCPASKEIPEEIPPYYMAQVQGLMEICDREWCDFVYWTPDAMRVRRIARSPEYWAWLRVRLADFWCWVVAQVEPPREKKQPTPNFNIQISLDSTYTFTKI